MEDKENKTLFIGNGYCQLDVLFDKFLNVVNIFDLYWYNILN